MEGIKSYFTIVEPHLLAQISGKPGMFIKLLRAKEFISEEAFKARICGEKYGDKYYRNLKSKTVKILQAMALISMPKGANTVKKNYDLCQKKFAVGQKFLNQGSRPEGLRLVKQAYTIAIEYDFVHLACELASILYRDHIHYHPSKRKAEYYSKQVIKHLENYRAEKIAEHYYFQVLQETRPKKQLELAQALSDKLEAEAGDTVQFTTYIYTIRVYIGFGRGNFDDVVRNCQTALQKFQDQKGVYSSWKQFFYTKQSLALIALGEYGQAQKCLIRAEQHTVYRSFNDYLLRYYKVLSDLHSGDYQGAYEGFKKGRHCKFEVIRQQFAILEAYFCFLTYLGRLDHPKPFRLGKYLNETFKAQEDKQGDNIAILIAELLIYLVRNRGKFIDRVEAVKHYSYRHLKDKSTQRAKAFIRILCLLPSANFHPVALLRLAKSHIVYLNAHPIHLGESIEVETIPFENLLEMVLEQLKKKVA